MGTAKNPSRGDNPVPETDDGPKLNRRIPQDSVKNGSGKGVDLVALRRRLKKEQHYLYLLIPAVLWFGLFRYVPMYGVTIAFKNYRILDGILGSPWVGFEHFARAFRSPLFLRVLRNTVWISLLRVLFGFPAPILLALLLNEVRHTGYKRIVQSVSYLPHFLSWVVFATLLIEVLSPTRGVVNYLIQRAGGEPVRFLTDPNVFVFTLISTGVWKGVGWGSIVYFAAISSIDPELYDYASVEGAGRFRKVLHITIPSIMPIVAIMLMLRVSDIMEAGFDQVFNLYNPLVYSVADIIDTYVYRRGLLEFEYSFSTAMNLFKNVIGMALVILANGFARRTSDYAIW